MAYLRRDEILPDEAVVVRGGILGGGVEELQEQAEDEFTRLLVEGDPDPVYGLSVCSLPNMTADEIAVAVGPERLPHARMRTTTVEALRACGYEVVPSAWRGHATIVLRGPATEEDWHNLQESFGEPMDNPVGRRRRTQ
ncbi:MAG: hypothetical protein JO372_02690 [Solirubrobacterales bacterium]|nr:hypothetical protein [Solirubrobacterales bacterium]